MAGVAIAGSDLLRWLVDGNMLVVVAAETAEPVFVSDVLGILAPVGLHEGEEVVFVDLGCSRDGLGGGRLITVLLAQAGFNRGGGLSFGGVGFG